VDVVDSASRGWALGVGGEETEAEVEHGVGLMLRRAMARRHCCDVLERHCGHRDRGWRCSRTPRQVTLQAHGKAGRGVMVVTAVSSLAWWRFDVDSRGAGKRVTVERLNGLEAATAVGWEMEEKGRRCSGFL
jgi:hypothetical protein